VKILVADDDLVQRRLLERTLTAWRYTVQTVVNGEEAWEVLSQATPPPLAMLDWMMPGLTGLDVCRRLRESGRTPYVILLTSKNRTEDLVAALDSGADDFIAKPFDPAELRARVRVGERIASLQNKLADRVSALENALAQVTQLQGLLPICMYCKKIRNDQNYWQRVESYIGEHSGATFSHGICPECIENRVRPEIERARRERGL
jgi:phosphoserine phosphatase RsbU/P